MGEGRPPSYYYERLEELDGGRAECQRCAALHGVLSDVADDYANLTAKWQNEKAALSKELDKARKMVHQREKLASLGLVPDGGLGDTLKDTASPALEVHRQLLDAIATFRVEEIQKVIDQIESASLSEEEADGMLGRAEVVKKKIKHMKEELGTAQAGVEDMAGWWDAVLSASETAVKRIFAIPAVKRVAPAPTSPVSHHHHHHHGPADELRRLQHEWVKVERCVRTAVGDTTPVADPVLPLTPASFPLPSPRVGARHYRDLSEQTAAAVADLEHLQRRVGSIADELTVHVPGEPRGQSPVTANEPWEREISRLQRAARQVVHEWKKLKEQFSDEALSLEAASLHDVVNDALRSHGHPTIPKPDEVVPLLEAVKEGVKQLSQAVTIPRGSTANVDGAVNTLVAVCREVLGSSDQDTWMAENVSYGAAERIESCAARLRVFAEHSVKTVSALQHPLRPRRQTVEMGLGGALSSARASWERMVDDVASLQGEVAALSDFKASAVELLEGLLKAAGTEGSLPPPGQLTFEALARLLESRLRNMKSTMATMEKEASAAGKYRKSWSRVEEVFDDCFGEDCEASEHMETKINKVHQLFDAQRSQLGVCLGAMASADSFLSMLTEAAGVRCPSPLPGKERDKFTTLAKAIQAKIEGAGEVLGKLKAAPGKRATDEEWAGLQYINRLLGMLHLEHDPDGPLHAKRSLVEVGIAQLAADLAERDMLVANLREKLVRYANGIRRIIEEFDLGSPRREGSDNPDGPPESPRLDDLERALRRTLSKGHKDHHDDRTLPYDLVVRLVTSVEEHRMLANDHLPIEARIAQAIEALHDTTDPAVVTDRLSGALRRIAHRMKAAITRHDLHCEMPSHTSDTNWESSLAVVDALSSSLVSGLDVILNEQAQVLASLDSLRAAAASIPGDDEASTHSQHNLPPEPSERRAVHLARLAASSVADLVGQYCGLRTRVQRLTNGVKAASTAIDKTLQWKDITDGSTSPTSRVPFNEAPELQLQAAISRLKSREQRARLVVGGDTGCLAGANMVLDEMCLSPHVREQLVRLAKSGAPTGNSPAELVEAIAQRLAAAESDRAAQRKDAERARGSWRKLHDEVQRKLPPLLDILPEVAGEEEGDVKNPTCLIGKIHTRTTALCRQYHAVSGGKDVQKYRLVDLEGRVKALTRQRDRAVKEAGRLCKAARLTPQHTDDGDIDLFATLKSLRGTLEQYAANMGEISAAKEEAQRQRGVAQAEMTKTARVEMQHMYLLNAVREALVALNLFPEMSCEEGSEWTAICDGMASLATEVKRGMEATQRVRRCEVAVEKMLTELARCGAVPSLEPGPPKARPPSRSPPPRPASPPHPSRSVSPPLSDSSDEGGEDPTLLHRCREVVVHFQRVRSAIEGEKRAKGQLLSALLALSRIKAVVSANSSVAEEAKQEYMVSPSISDTEDPDASPTFRTHPEGSSPSAIDPAAVADAVAAKISSLIEVSAVASAEKAAQLRACLEAKEAAEKFRELADQYSHEIGTLQQEKEVLLRKLSTSAVFARYAKEMEESCTGRSSPSVDSAPATELTESTAINAYKAFLSLRKERDELREQLTEVESELAEKQESDTLLDDFIAGVLAKLSTAVKKAGEVVAMVADPTGRRPSRSPPLPPQDPSDESPKAVLAAITLLTGRVQASVTHLQSLGHKVAKLMFYMRALAHSAKVEAPDEDDEASLPSAIDTLLCIAEDLMKAELDRASRPPSRGSPAPSLSLYPSPPRRSHSANSNWPAVCEEIASALECAMSYLRPGALARPHSATASDEEALSKYTVSAAWQVEAACSFLMGELKAVVGECPPSDVLHRVREAVNEAKSTRGAPAEPRLPPDIASGVHEIARQIDSIASAVSQATLRDTALVLRQASYKDTSIETHEDPFGLISALRKLLQGVAGKVEKIDIKGAADSKAKVGMLQSHITEMEQEQERKELKYLKAIEGEKQATQMLAIQKGQWAAAKKSLEDRLHRSEGERRAALQARDEAQSALAVCRSELEEARKKHPSLPTSPVLEATSAPLQSMTAAIEEVRRDLEAKVQEKTAECEELAAYAEKVKEKLEEKEHSKREYKEKYRQALGVIDTLEQERNQQRKDFQAQLTEVKEQLLRLHGAQGGRPQQPHLPHTSQNLSQASAKMAAYHDAKRADHAMRTSPSHSRSASAARSKSPITVPQEFRFGRTRGRTGCWVCDSPDGPTKYGTDIAPGNLASATSLISPSRKGASRAEG